MEMEKISSGVWYELGDSGELGLEERREEEGGGGRL